jgi:hypothetical protein
LRGTTSWILNTSYLWGVIFFLKHKVMVISIMIGLSMIMSFQVLVHKTNSLPPLKGQCHEIVVEMSPWSSNLALN